MANKDLLSRLSYCFPVSKKLLFLCLLPMIACVLSAANAKPFTVPEVRQWKGGEGQCCLSGRVVYQGKESQRVAQLLAADYSEMFGRALDIVPGKAAEGDIVLTEKTRKALGQEGYSLDITHVVTLMGGSKQGLYWATRTLLQLMEHSHGTFLPRGQILDRLQYAYRGFMLDCGRKFFPMSMLRQYVKMMAYYKMNAFHIHLNDNAFPWFYNYDWSKVPAAFRLESDVFPGLTARDGHYTKADFMALQDLADSLGVEIIPEIDVPAHSLALTRYRPSLASKDYDPDHLNLLNPATTAFCDSLFIEYLSGPNPVFKGKYMHIGTDEYSNKDQKVVEAFRAFTDHYIRLVESFGKKAAIWGQQTHAKGITPIKVKDVLMYAWSNDYANPEEMMKLGYHLVSIPDGQVYIVPKAGYYYDYLDTRQLYDSWTPANINGEKFSEDNKQIEGGSFAVWNDIVGNGISDKDVHYRVVPALRTMAAKMWTASHVTFPYAEFAKESLQLHEAPGVNYAGRQPYGTVLEKASLTCGERLPLEQIGWHYSVSFDIDAKTEQKGTTLFSFGDTKLYLADPIGGMLAFSRDGYLDSFGYQFFPGEKAHVEIMGDQEKTTLKVNGRVVSDLSVRKINFGKRGDMYYISTLVCPLQQVGQFNSRVTNLKVVSE